MVANERDRGTLARRSVVTMHTVQVHHSEMTLRVQSFLNCSMLVLSERYAGEGTSGLSSGIDRLEHAAGETKHSLFPVS